MPTVHPAATRFQCRHIFTDGQRCGSPALRAEPFCYYHHSQRPPATNPRVRRRLSNTFALPNPEDRSAIQAGIGLVLERIAQNALDPRRAGLLLYGLQIASLNLPRQTKQSASATQPVSELLADPVHGPLAPVSEFPADRTRRAHEADLRKFMGLNPDLANDLEVDPAYDPEAFAGSFQDETPHQAEAHANAVVADPARTIPTLRAVAAPAPEPGADAACAGRFSPNARNPPFRVGPGVAILCRRSPNLPHTYACSTIGPTRLNFRVRDGNGCDPRGKLTGKV